MPSRGGASYEGIVYRTHHPRGSDAPTSGGGAARHGGRFNPRGLPALYSSLDPKTAWMEAQQGMPFKAQPLTMVAYRVDCERIADLTDPRGLATAGLAAEMIARPWELLAANGRGRQPGTWRSA